MSSDKTIHNRHSIRIPGYDYSIPDFYFITICTENKQCIFGHIRDGKMVLNNLGEIVYESIIKIPIFCDNKVIIHELIVMPNHIHILLELVGSVGADIIRPIGHTVADNLIGGNAAEGRMISAPTSKSYLYSKSLSSIVRGFKSGVTKQIGRSIWQRNYYEHIVRDNKDYENIRGYILTNPATWDADVLFERSVDEFNKMFINFFKCAFS